MSADKIHSEDDPAPRRLRVCRHLGGIKIDPASYEVIDASGSRNGSMRVVGELTTGAFFFTSALDINARHARQCVDALCQTLRRAQGRTRFDFVDHTGVGNEA